MHIHGNLTQTLSLQASYDTKLNNATYDALKAFQLNTVNSSTSDLSNSKIRDVEASVNTFYNSIATNFNMDGYNRDILKEYVPALVYTMYDGYYIYSSYTNTLTSDDYVPVDKVNGVEGSTYQDGEKLSGLKPYVFYSCRYKKTNGDDFTITYSLDNYITIKGIINGKAVDDAGYLVSGVEYNEANNTVTYRGCEINSEYLTENLVDDNGIVCTYNYTKVNGVKYYLDDDNGKWFSLLNGEKYYQSYNFKIENNSAKQYYIEAAEFKKRIMRDYDMDNLKASDAVYEDGAKEKDGKTMLQQLGRS